MHSPSVQEARGVHVKATAAWKRDEKGRRVVVKVWMAGFGPRITDTV